VDDEGYYNGVGVGGRVDEGVGLESIFSFIFIIVIYIIIILPSPLKNTSNIPPEQQRSKYQR